MSSVKENVIKAMQLCIEAHGITADEIFSRPASERKWQVLSIKNTLDDAILDVTGWSLYDIDHALDNNPEYYSLYSIKRLKDGEIFTIGDRLNGTRQNTILKIGLDTQANDMWLYVNIENGFGAALSFAKKAELCVEEKFPIQKWKILSIATQALLPSIHNVANWKADDVDDVLEKDPYKWSIHSIQRLRDGAVFTVGDILDMGNSDYQPITKIHCRSNADDMWLYAPDLVGGWALNEAPRIEPKENQKDIPILDTWHSWEVLSYRVKDEQPYVIIDVTHMDWLVAKTTPEDYEIYSIKRLTDGEVFTIGDLIIDGIENRPIESIQWRDKCSEMCLYTDEKRNNGSALHCAMKAPTKPKFKLVTEDRVSIEDPEQPVYALLPKAQWDIRTIRARASETWKAWMFFSTSEARAQYIMRKKPTMCLEDVATMLGFDVASYGIKNFREFVYNKLHRKSEFNGTESF